MSMMRNRDRPATAGSGYPGLTKREAAAISAMHAHRIAFPDWLEAAIAIGAMEDADALFDELEKPLDEG